MVGQRILRNEALIGPKLLAASLPRTNTMCLPLDRPVVDSITEKTQVLIRRAIILPGRAALGLKQHRAVLAAMRRGDAPAAEELRRENMRSAKAFLQRYEKYVL